MAWDAAGKALCERTLQRALPAVVHNRSGFRAKRLFFGLHAPKYVQKIRGDVVRVRLQSSEPLAQNTVVFARGTPLRLPDSRDIGLAVQAGCGSSQVRLAVFRAWDVRIGIVQPLGISIQGSGKSDSNDRNEGSSITHGSAMLPLAARRS